MLLFFYETVIYIHCTYIHVLRLNDIILKYLRLNDLKLIIPNKYFLNKSKMYP